MSNKEEINKKLIPEGMTVERYRELIKKVNTPEALGNEEIKQITEKWKSYAKEHHKGPPEKKVTTQDIVREETKQASSKSFGGEKQKKTNTSSNKVKEETITTKKLVREQMEKESKKQTITIKNLNELESAKQSVKNGPTKLQSKVIKTAPKVMTGAALFIGATSLLSTAMKKKDKAEEKAQTRSMEKRIKKDAKKEAEKKDRYQKDNGFRNVDAGQIVMDLFNERIGHHKMGNSRF